MISVSPSRKIVAASVICVALAGCEQSLDFDLRGLGGGFSTTQAAQSGSQARPSPDDRGVITYPNYQVVVASRDETINDIAARLNVSAEELATFNGLQADVPLRKGEVVALPKPANGAQGTASGPVDISALADNAINRAPQSTNVQTATLPPAEPAPTPQVSAPKPAPAAIATETQEPIRHKVVRGETAFIVSRLYNVRLKSLAEWNGLGPDFAIREGQFLLIPVANQAPPVQTATSKPGVGSATPTPPSARKPLPKDEAPAPTAKPAEPAADVGATTPTATAVSAMDFPVSGSIIREYAKGRNDGIDIKAAPGTAVKAADTGTIAAITKSADGIPIIVVRHEQNLLTVYANVIDVTVEKGDAVKRGQRIANLRTGDDAFVHFEVRKGFESVDPLPYLQ